MIIENPTHHLRVFVALSFPDGRVQPSWGDRKVHLETANASAFVDAAGEVRHVSVTSSHGFYLKKDGTPGRQSAGHCQVRLTDDERAQVTQALQAEADRVRGVAE